MTFYQPETDLEHRVRAVRIRLTELCNVVELDRPFDYVFAEKSVEKVRTPPFEHMKISLNFTDCIDGAHLGT